MLQISANQVFQNKYMPYPQRVIVWLVRTVSDKTADSLKDCALAARPVPVLLSSFTNSIKVADPRQTHSSCLLSG